MLGEGIAEAQVIRLLVKPGDVVAEDQYLMEVETDKAAVEIPSPFAGVVKDVHVKEGDTVNVGSVIVTIDNGNGAAVTEKPTAKLTSAATGAGSSATATVATAADAPVTAPPSARKKTTAAAAPAVRKLARELGVDLDAIPGSGPGGRITREDVERARSGGGGVATNVPVAAQAVAIMRAAGAPGMAIPGKADLDKWGRIYREPINQIRKTIASQMTRSAYTAVHVTHGDEADITELDRVRRELNEATGNDPKLTIMSFLIRALCLALRKYPIFNSSFDVEAEEIVYKEYINVGVAVDTDRGLIVPVVRNADQLTLRGIAMALRGIAERIRANQFAIEDLRGGTFTITNVGALGGTFSTPIINYPEVAILGLGRSRKTPVIKDDELAEALVLPLNMSFDHRATDGANAARFTREIISYLEMPARLLLD